MSQFGVRLSDEEPDLDQIARATGLTRDAVQRHLADGFLARGLSRRNAELMVADLAQSGVPAEVCQQTERSVAKSLLGAPSSVTATQLGLPALPKRALTKGLPGLGLGRSVATTMLGPPAPAEPVTGEPSALPPPKVEPGDLPPMSLPPPTSDAELLPSLKVDDPAALPPPKVFKVASPRQPTPAPPRAQPAAPAIDRPARAPSPDAAPLPSASTGTTLRSATSAAPAEAPPTPRPSTPIQRVPLDVATTALIAAPSRSTRVPWVIAAILVLLSGVFVAWAWSGRDAGLNALRRAEAAYAQGEYAQAAIEAERARTHGADAWADRMQAACAAAPHVDRAQAALTRDDLQAARLALDAARAVAPKDPRTLQLAVTVLEKRASIARPARRQGVASAIPASPIAPASMAPAPATQAPASAAPAQIASTAPVSRAAPPAPAAPTSVALETAAPTVAAPGSAPPEVRFARPPSAPTKDRSKVARLKIVGDMIGEIVVDGDRVSVAVPGWIEVKPGRRKIAVRGIDGEVHGLRAVKVQAGRRAKVRLTAQ